MKFTRPRDLAIAVLVAGVLAHLLMRAAYGSMPPLPPLAGLTLLAIAVAELVLGFSLRSRIRRTARTRPVQALTAARAVALAKASSMVGAIMLGAWLGVLVYIFPRRGELIAASDDLPSTIIGALCSAALIGAALWLEHCCRTPDDHGDDPR